LSAQDADTTSFRAMGAAFSNCGLPAQEFTQGGRLTLQISERYWAGKRRLLGLLDEIESSEWCRHTLYLTPTSLESRLDIRKPPPSNSLENQISDPLQQTGESETGLVLFVGDDRTIAIAPPFPLHKDLQAEGAAVYPLVQLLNRELTVGVVLLRLGRYAVGVLRGESLVASKTDTRYVKSRHRAGGSSQRRFERSRERLVRELFDKVCEITQVIFTPYGGSINYVLMGGERHVLKGLVKRCRYLKDIEGKTLKRTLQVDRPGQAALEKIGREVWKSRVMTFTGT
jgi:hypothetical protein